MMPTFTYFAKWLILVIVFTLSFLPLDLLVTHYLRPKGHIYVNCPDVTPRCIKVICSHVLFHHCAARTVYYYCLRVRL